MKTRDTIKHERSIAEICQQISGGVVSLGAYLAGLSRDDLAVSAPKLAGRTRSPGEEHRIQTAIQIAMACLDDPALEVPRHKDKRGIAVPVIIGESPAIKRLLSRLHKLAESGQEPTVLITGPTGAGKELVAQAICARSRRATPFRACDCGAIPEHLCESILFGYVKGAFTGAAEGKKGLLGICRGGTLFLDEIHNLPISAQSSLLCALSRKEFYPVGSTTPVPMDVRIIAAINEEPDALISTGRLKKDLYYRLKKFCVSVPPLADRVEDIPYLVAFYLKEHRKTISREAMEMLCFHPWEGNVRELRDTLQEADILCDHGTIVPEDLVERIGDRRPTMRFAGRIQMWYGQDPVEFARWIAQTLGTTNDYDLVVRVHEAGAFMAFYDRLRQMGLRSDRAIVETILPSMSERTFSDYRLKNGIRHHPKKK